MMITIIGAGMSGLLAANMLRSPWEMFEASPSIPNGHKALLRFRSSAVGDVCGITFKKVKVMKSSSCSYNPVAGAIAYSKKATGEYSMRSLVKMEDDIVERYIAPPDLIQKMCDNIDVFNIRVNHRLVEVKDTSLIFDSDGGVRSNLELARGTIISTLPMPTMMELLEYPDIPAFRYRSGVAVQFSLRRADIYASVYIPDLGVPAYRASITGDRIIVEYAQDIEEADYDRIAINAMEVAEEYLGIDTRDIYSPAEVASMKYLKIVPIDEELRRNFIMWASMKHKVYSLGRFATWRPGLLMDDVVQDVRVIERLINSQDYYPHLLK